MHKGDPGYEAHRQRAAANSRQQSAEGRDIGPLPDVQNPERKEACRLNFRLFCETYFPELFALEWSPDHLRVIERIEDAVLRGGTFAMAMPRGSGKTTLCEVAAVWSLVYGHRRFVVCIGADKDSASDMLESIKITLANNPELGDDFPEACYPIARLEGIAHRAKGQLLDGQNTNIGWTADELKLPRVKGSPCSESVVRVAGITGRIRGMKMMRSDNTSARPDLVLIDDPQTDESGRSPSQCATRERVLAGAILGLAGPGCKIAGLMTMTVIRKGDMADNILDREKHPQWQGERTKMVYKFPKNEKLWSEYNKIREECLRTGESTERANEFYRANFDAMNDGAEVAWEARKNPDELTGLQHAMNLKFRDEEAFYAEYQNEPIDEAAGDEDALTAEFVQRKVNNLDRALVPVGTTKLTMFIDVQGKMLFWTVVAWGDGFTGNVIDYGSEPEQGDRYFTLRHAKKTLQAVYPGDGLEAMIYKGLESLCERTLGRPWQADGGGEISIDRCMIDANWGSSTEVVYQFCRQSRFSGVLIPSHGKYVGASSVPMGEYKKKRGDRLGTNWRIPGDRGQRGIRHILYDTNYWKSFVHARLRVSMGDPGCLALWGPCDDRHRLFAEHVTAEDRVPTEGRGRRVDEWKLPPDGRDNHWFDCLVGCAVAASEQGIVGVGHKTAVVKKKKARSFSEIQRDRAARR